MASNGVATVCQRRQGRGDTCPSHTLLHPQLEETGFKDCGVSLEITALDNTYFGLATIDVEGPRYAEATNVVVMSL